MKDDDGFGKGFLMGWGAVDLADTIINHDRGRGAYDYDDYDGYDRGYDTYDDDDFVPPLIVRIIIGLIIFGLIATFVW